MPSKINIYVRGWFLLVYLISLILVFLTVETVSYSVYSSLFKNSAIACVISEKLFRGPPVGEVWNKCIKFDGRQSLRRNIDSCIGWEK